MSKRKYTGMSFDEGDETNYTQLWRKMKAAWPWFLGTFVVLCLAVFFYIQYATPLYNIHAMIKISSSTRGGSAAGDQSLTEELGVSTTSSVDEEAVVLKTRSLMEKVVRDMKLDVLYYRKEGFRTIEMYQPPFVVEVIDPLDSIKFTMFDATVLSNGKVELKWEDSATQLSFNNPLKVAGVGTIQLGQADERRPLPGEYSFTISSVDKAVSDLSNSLEVALFAKQVAILDLNFSYPLPKKGEDILNRLLDLYVQTNLEDRNRLADSSVAFIQNRLSFLGAELGDLEGDIQSFKQRNRIAEMSEQSKVMVQNTSQFMNEVAKAETQINVLTSLQEYLQSNAGNDRVVPSSLVVSDPTFSDLVEKYNTLLLERDKRMVGVTAKNPVITNINERIANLRADMLSSLVSSKRSLGITLTNLRRQMQSVEGQVQGVPRIERNYLDLARQQQIKQELYIFLMQKREESAIAKTYNTPNSKKIDPPKTQGKVSPKAPVYYTVATLLSLLLPASVIYLRFLTNTRIENKDDIRSNSTLPVVAEISHNTDSETFIVALKPRTPVAEQFRALRTKLLLNLRESDNRVILLTSSVTGEGKSFISANLASIFALSNKKVLLMELDLRKPGLSAKLEVPEGPGFTDFIQEEELYFGNIIKPSGILDNLYIMSSGTLRPNPAEILMSSRVSLLFEALRTQFDYIVIDAPPVGVVTDAQLLMEHADTCLYVVRQHLTLKSQLAIADELKNENPTKHMAMVLNDIQAGSGYTYGQYDYHAGERSRFRKVKGLFAKA